MARLPVVRVTAVDGGEPEIEVGGLCNNLCNMYLDLGSSQLKKMVIVLRWTTTQVLLAALM